MTEPSPTAGPSDLSTNGDEFQRNSLFLGPDGLRPFWRLLLYLAILTPILLLMVLSHFADAKTSPHPAVVDEISPLSSTITEWLQFGFVFFATWIMSRIENRSAFDYGLARTPRRLYWLLIGALLGLIFQSLLIVILWSTHHLVFAG
ncbi:MAG TPA: hypothetical protein VN734_03345, partial [Acidobacteriaceae bacterium]|nr:hypothetical protein [Acidobacteriaceae bacterium]